MDADQTITADHSQKGQKDQIVVHRDISYKLTSSLITGLLYIPRDWFIKIKNSVSGVDVCGEFIRREDLDHYYTTSYTVIRLLLHRYSTIIRV